MESECDTEKVGVSWNVDVERERRHGKKSALVGTSMWKANVEAENKRRQGHQTFA